MDVGLLILGVVAGVLSGLFGIGGGVVMVPSLIALFGLNILDANATSLAAMLLPVGILGVVTYYRAGYINVRDSLWISAGLLLGSFFGAELAVNVNEGLLAKLYAAFLLYIAVGYLDIPFFFKKKRLGEIKKEVPTQKAIWGFILVGVVAGIIAGMFGKGGGIIIIPALVKLFHYDAKSAAATSLAALQLPVGLPSVIVYANGGHFNYQYAGLIAFGIVLGAFLGTKIAVRMPVSIFKKVFAAFLLAVAFFMVFKYV
jgi:uncharacterized membrane protein YfcA